MPTPDARRARISLRLRLTVWVVAVFVLIQLFTGASFWFLRRAEGVRLFRQGLSDHAASLARAAEKNFDELNEETLTNLGDHDIDVVQFPWIELDIVGSGGRSLVRTEALWPDATRRLIAQRNTGRSELWTKLDDPSRTQNPLAGGDVIAVAVPIALPDRTGSLLIVTTTDAFFVRQTSLLTRVLLSAGLLGIAASAVSGWVIAGIAVAPIHKLSKLAGEIGPETIENKIDLSDQSSEVQELSVELNEARARIREAFAAQERFLSNISHEIKTPIATLLLEAQTINKSSLSEEALDFVDTAEDEMRKLGRLIESFLTLTRVRNGGKPARLKRYPANELVMDAMEDCLPYAEEYDVILAPTLDDRDEMLDARVVGDPALMRTMLNNLIRNAVRFSQKGEQVEIKAKSKDGRYIVEVLDHGPGLPDEIIPNIFDRFVQSPPEARRKRGQGLGLAIAKGIAELHGGDITARNADEGGAVFTVNLPLAAEAPSTSSDA